ncbi:MAG TPA: site-specific integrase [Micromonosporaceae bacterium]|jgi:integrase
MPRPGKRRFGRIRKLPSGRFQARYRGPDSVDRPAPHIFATRTDAERWLAVKEGEIIRGDWTDPDDGKIPIDNYVATWIEHRAGLRPRTVDLYRWLSRKYINDYLGVVAVADLTPAGVRAWRAQLVAAGTSPTMIAKAYRLLRAVLNTAVDDEIIRRNPCRIKGAGQEVAAERPVATIVQVYELAEHVPARFRVLILLAAFTSLRYGELVALRRRDVDVQSGKVTVRAALIERQDGSLTFGPPKTSAGSRTVTAPAAIRGDLAAHLRDFTRADSDALVFTGVTGAALRRSNFQRTARWAQSVAAVGLPRFHFHDLRHTGNNLAAATGANLRDLMHRMGHASTRAAIIYQHATEQRDREIAAALSAHIQRDRDRARSGHARREDDQEGQRP